jgi:hypothetical protein
MGHFDVKYAQTSQISGRLRNRELSPSITTLPTYNLTSDLDLAICIYQPTFELYLPIPNMAGPT